MVQSEQRKWNKDQNEKAGFWKQKTKAIECTGKRLLWLALEREERKEMYHQKQLLLYNSTLTKLPMLSSDLTVNYIEMLDSSCVEFPHTHLDYEIYYCLEGVLNIQVKDTRLSLEANHFVLISPGCIHGSIYEPNRAKKYFVFVFNIPNPQGFKKSEVVEKSFFELFHQCFLPDSFFHGKDRNHCRRLVEAMNLELDERKYGWELMMRNHYLNFIIGVLRNLIPTTPAVKENEFGNNLAIEITKFMHNNYDKNITLQDVANAIYVTPRHVSRLFLEYFGQSFQKTLSIYRVNYAKNYLLDTDYSIEKIAGLVGFASAQSLYKLFRELEGISISEYRAQNHSNK